MGVWRQTCKQCKKTKTVSSFRKAFLDIRTSTTCKVCDAKNDVFRERRNDKVRELWAKKKEEIPKH